jgi:cytochrome c-type biogenesis protein CcmF
MVVHLGVALVAVAFAASASYANRVEFTALKPGQTVTVSGHHVTYVGWHDVTKTQYTAQVAALRVDGHKMQYPTLRRYPAGNQVVGTPSVWSTPTHDSYMALLDLDPTTSEISLRVIVEPMVMWLWIGGAVMAIGTALAAFPGKRRRRPTDPASAPIPGVAGRRDPAAGVSPAPSEPPHGEPEPVGAAP